METFCKKCIANGEEKWRSIKTEVYKKLFSTITWFSSIDKKRSNTIRTNIAGQLQLIEIFEKLHTDCDLDTQNVLGDEKQQRGNDSDSEIESMLIKQEICAIGAIAEAICYVILKSNNVSFPKSTVCGEDTRFFVMLKLIENKNLLPKDEIVMCKKIKELRNRIHIYEQIETDFETFSRNEYDLAGKCLYFLLQRWLRIETDTMQIYFPFIPIASKKILPFNSSKF